MPVVAYLGNTCYYANCIIIKASNDSDSEAKDDSDSEAKGDSDSEAKDDSDKVLIQECSSCGGPIHQGEPMAKFFCMAGWTCQHCLPDCKHLLKCPDTIKRNFTDSEEAKDDSEEDFYIFYQPTGTNQIFPLTVKASDTIDIVVSRIHKLVSVRFEGFDSDLIEDRSKESLIIIFEY